MKKTTNNGLPAVAWLKVTNYMRGWLEHELGCALRAHGQPVICVQHLPGAREILRMETVEDMMDKQPLGIALSATRRNCFDAGLAIDADVMEREYGVTKEALKGFVPIECPRMCLTRNGVLRPWTLLVGFSLTQAIQLQRLLRQEFWKAVEAFDARYAEEQGGEWYAAKDMVEEFCAETQTPDYHVEAIRREWQRRVKRKGGLKIED